jgi:glycosyltransferase involved in cell wall biosynthesis
MKILHINTFDTGGAAIACLRIHQELLNQGVDSHVLVRNKKKKSLVNVYEIWEELNPVQKTAKLIAQKKNNKFNYKKYHNNFNEIERYSPSTSIWDITTNKHYQEADIIHLHWVEDFIDYPSFFEKCDKKIIWTLHDFAPFSDGFHYPVDIQQEYKELLNSNFKIKQLALKNSAIKIVSPSNYLLNQSIKSKLFKAYNHTNIPNGTSTEFVYNSKEDARKKLDFSANQKIILFVSDTINYKRKGFQLLLNALKLLKEENVSLYAVGSGKLNYPGVKCLGEINNEQQLNLIYSAANLFVIPSLNDNYPNTVAEALCSGTPTIGFNVGGIPEMINNSNGIICESLNPSELAKSIIKGLNTDFNYKKISVEAAQKFSITNCAKSYQELYNKEFNR